MGAQFAAQYPGQILVRVPRSGSLVPPPSVAITTNLRNHMVLSNINANPVYALDGIMYTGTSMCTPTGPLYTAPRLLEACDDPGSSPSLPIHLSTTDGSSQPLPASPLELKVKKNDAHLTYEAKVRQYLPVLKWNLQCIYRILALLKEERKMVGENETTLPKITEDGPEIGADVRHKTSFTGTTLASEPGGVSSFQDQDTKHSFRPNQPVFDVNEDLCNKENKELKKMSLRAKRGVGGLAGGAKRPLKRLRYSGKYKN